MIDSVSSVELHFRDVFMSGATRLRFAVLLCGLLVDVVAAVGDETKSPASKSVAERNAMKVPTKIAGSYNGGELVELRVRERIAYLIKPTGEVDPQKRWFGTFRFGLRSMMGLAVWRTATTLNGASPLDST